MLIIDELYVCVCVCIESYAFIYIMFEFIKQHVDMINVYMIIILLYFFDKKNYYNFLIVNFIE